ncbi:MAG: YezD family protein [Opitutaceae bacterium]|nr:YezD family protein [Opitutaceae bacterium]
MNEIIASAAKTEPGWFAIVRSNVESLRYGVVQLVVHDGRVTQIERTEKTRLEDPAAADFARRRVRS